MTLIQNDLQLISMLHLIKSDILSKNIINTHTQPIELHTDRKTIKLKTIYMNTIITVIQCITSRVNILSIKYVLLKRYYFT